MGVGTRLVGLLTILAGFVILLLFPPIGIFLGGLLMIIGIILLIPELVAAVLILGFIAIIILFFFLR